MKPVGDWVHTGVKVCAQCGLEKPIEDFGKNSKGSPTWCSPCRTEKSRRYMRDWRAKNPDHAAKKAKSYKLRQYNLTPDEFAYMVLEQGGVCAICQKVPEILYVDHDHNTGVIRGLLCQKCNSGIGFLGDTLEGLEKAVKYLKDARDKEIN